MLSVSNTATWATYPHPFDLVAHILKHRDENSSYVLEKPDVQIGTERFKFSNIVLEKALCTFLVNENLYFSDSLQSSPRHSAWT